MTDDRSWTYTNWRINRCVSLRFREGVKKFLEFACAQHTWMDGQKIKCPCRLVKCQNRAFREEKWASEDFQKISAKQKANITSETGGNKASERGGTGVGPSRHTGGSRSMADHARAFEEKYGRRPSKIELFDLTHMTQPENGPRIYIDNRAKCIGEALTKKKNDFLYASEGVPRVDSEGNPTILTTEVEDQLFMDVVYEDLSDEDGPSRRYLYGTGGNKELSLRSDASTSMFTPQIQEMVDEIHSLNQTMADKDAAAI